MQKWHEKANGPGQKPKKATKRHSKGWTKRVDVSQQENMRFSWYFHRNSKDFAGFQLFLSLSASARLKEPFVSKDGATHPLIQLYPVYITFVVAILWCFSCDIIIFGGYQPNWPCSGKTLAFFSVSTGPLGSLGPPLFYMFWECLRECWGSRTVQALNPAREAGTGLKESQKQTWEE